MDPWDKLNERRIALVCKQEAIGLSESETQELQSLYEMFSVYAKHINRKSPFQRLLRLGGIN